jgi:hypothetical protein
MERTFFSILDLTVAALTLGLGLSMADLSLNHWKCLSE